MLSAGRQSTRSPTTSQTDSYGAGSVPRTNGRPYPQRSSINEENERDDNEYEPASDDIDEQERTYRPPPRNEDPYLSALKLRFPNRPRTDYAYSRPSGPPNPSVPPPPPPPPPTTLPTTTATISGSTRTPNSGPYQSAIRPSGGTTVSDASDDRTFPRPALRRVNPEQQNTYARRISSETITPTPSSKPISSGGANVRITEPTIDTDQPIMSTFAYQSGIPRPEESIFETIPSHGGPVSYLGIGTFSQFEQCLRECLERERRQTGIASQITRHDIPPNMSVHDYGYDPAVASSHPPQEFYPSSNPYLIDYPSRSSPTLLLDDIRHINVALSKSGISLYPYERFSPESFCYPGSMSIPSRNIHSTYPTERRIIGEVVSACRFVEEDSELLYNRHRNQAVQSVSNALQDHRPFSYIDDSMSSIYPRGPYDI
ncbi:unnamed protein product [Rotaria sp. Silwood2]|nr:unnamed protein product [Rotaria sp. Silwood2]CAF2788604.1 unnamed protein product [Rotaria sp. Silwood2]CAF3090911.1 unnamed protein product [Rotaria sp. Silwood2]CAF3174193.1 unnamed protein product [Rotaria sp. Silwood2]CAF4081808.1 unnamed protein product [Rotaria sp. Silwood2]